jgi:hypothetical protein
MQQLFREITGLDIFLSKTIASACMRHFRTNHLPNSEHLALVSESGYGMDKNFKQSCIARKFLRWYEHSRNVNLRTSDSPEYEKKIAQYWVDGFIDRSKRPVGHQNKDLIVEVHGCYW